MLVRKFWTNYERVALNLQIFCGYGYIWALTRALKILSWKLLLGMVVFICRVSDINILRDLCKMCAEADFRCPDENNWQPSHEVRMYFVMNLSNKLN
jgi:hypothetical protein